MSVQSPGSPMPFLTAQDTTAVAPGPAGQAAPTQAFLINLWRLMVRRKWVILSAMLVALAAVLVLTLFMTPKYVATATIEIAREERSIVDVNGVEPTSNSAEVEFYETQYSLLEARSLAERVSNKLQLANDEEFFDAFGVDPDGSLLDDGAGGRPTREARAEREEAAVDILLNNIEILPERGSALVDVAFESPSPRLSARVANAWTTEFIQENLDRRFESTSYAREYLEERLEQLRSRLEESERDLVQYAAAQGLVTVQTGSGTAPGEAASERPLIADDLTILNQELNRATAERIRALSKTTGSGSGADIANNPALAQLRRERAEIAAEHANLLSKFSPEYPPAAALKSQLDDLDRSIANERQLLQSGLRNEYRDAVQREEALRSRVEALKDQNIDLRRRNIQYDILAREADTNRQLYDALLQRYKEIGVAGGVGVNNVLIVDAATEPDSPSSPNLPLNLALGLLAGLILSGTFVFAVEQFDDAVKDVEGAKAALPVPVLGAIPLQTDADIAEELSDPKSAITEAYLSAQTSLEFSTQHGVPKSLAVTSTRSGEGKSTTSFALANTLKRIGQSVVLIDADMRSPSQHKLFGLENEYGLSNYMSGQDNIEELLHRGGNLPFPVMTAGPPPPNAAELLTGNRLKALLDYLLESFDHVIVDSPPVLGLADAPLIGNQVEAMVFAVEAYGPRVGAVRAALARLAPGHANVVGAILTKFQEEMAEYAYGSQYEYSYGQAKE